ncbi:MAG TPA: sigma-70 family RNA polymerase sigma factor [Roseiflexaceae bacterium]
MGVLSPRKSGRTAPEDEALLARVAAGDSSALETLYDRYARVVYSTALRILGTAELAEEVVQEAFWRVWRRSGTFQSGRGQVSSWILGIAHNLAIDELRRQRARPIQVYDEEDRPVLRDMEDSRIDVAGAALEEEQRRLISAALEQIPIEQREAIELAYFGGLSQSEIAARLQNPLGTVKTRIRLGLQKLRDILTAQGLQPLGLDE